MDKQDPPETLEKPRASRFRPELTRLPRLTPARQVYRRFIRLLCRLLAALFLRLEVSGLENFPHKGPGLVVVNHLGDADMVVGEVVLPVQVEALGKSEIYDFFLLGPIIHAFGIIWVHRGTADRRAIREALQGLEQGKFVAIAPEGRESLTGSLEEGLGGAAYLAVKSGAPIIPVTFTGTENWRIYGNMKRLRRTSVTVTVGKVFQLEPVDEMRQAVQAGTEAIMLALAKQLPEEYRGAYSLRQESRQG